MAQQHAPELAVQFVKEIMDVLVVSYDSEAFKAVVWRFGDGSTSHESEVRTLASQIAHDVARYADSAKLIEQCLDHPFIAEYANGGALVALESAWAALLSRDNPEEKGAYYEVVGDAIAVAIAKGVGLADLRQGIESVAVNAPDVLDQLATDHPDRASMIYRLAGRHTARYVQPLSTEVNSEGGVKY